MIDETLQLSAQAVDETGAAVAGAEIEWSTADAAIAVVDGSGLVQGRAPGQAFVRARVGDARDSAVITVLAPLPAALELERLATGVTASHGGSPAGDPRLFLTTLDGRVLALSGAGASPSLFLDLRDRVKGGAHGLYSIAFHPRFGSNGYFYVAYVDDDSSLQIERYTATGTAADPGSAKPILEIQHPPPFDHFGGWIGFGPDGLLYITSGDGGPGNSATAQDLGSLLGKVLRIDVDRGDPYAVPSSNPFVTRAGARPEIWASGLRNPWRASIDPVTRLLYIADVGEDDWEEVNVVDSGLGGLNYGWDRFEGSSCFPPQTTGCDRSGITFPQLEYPLTGSPSAPGASHPTGCSVTGGMVYRGTRIPGIHGHYFYADFCAGWVRSFRFDEGVVDQRQWFSGVGAIISFAQDSNGELYVLTLAGDVFRIDPALPQE